MRILISIILLITFFEVKAQGSLNMSLMYQWEDATLTQTSDGSIYNEIWGYAKDGREYAIIASTMGTHIFDVTDVNNVDTLDFIPGKAQGSGIIHRDYHTYKDYLYMVCDEGASSLQIADLSFLPDSAPVVYDSDALIVTSHNIFIDTVSGNLYSCGGSTNLGANYLSVYSLSADPTNPQFELNCGNDISFWNADIGYIHDIYVENDTAYCNSIYQGLFVVDFNSMPNIQVLGSLTSYLQKGYNHSGWLHKSGDYYAMADENYGLDVKILDVADLSNISLIDTIDSGINDSLSIPHNLIFRGDHLFVSYYFDGIYAFNTSDVNNISLAGYYDTSVMPHIRDEYDGCWGVYPFLPSGKILVSDRQEGLIVLDANFVVGIDEANPDDFGFIVYPNPTKNAITVTTTLFEDVLVYSIIDLKGRVVVSGNLSKAQTKIELNNISVGVYAFSILKKDGSISTKKFIKQ